MEYIPFILLVLGVVGYVYWKYSQAGAGGMAAYFGFPKGQRVKYMWVGEYQQQESVMAKAGKVALTVAFRMKSNLRPKGAFVAISSNDLLGLAIDKDEDVIKHTFQAQDGLKIEDLGQGSRNVQGGPSALIRFSAANFEPLELLLHESAPPLLAQWMGQRRVG